MKKTVSGIVFLLCLLSFLLTPAAFAESGTFSGEDGSLEVLLKADGKALEGGSLSFYRVGRLTGSKNAPKVEFTEDYRDSGLSLKELTDPAVIEAYKNYTINKQITGTTLSVTKGHVYFTVPKEALGVYLVVQNEACEGYETSNPFFVTIPSLDRGVYEYHVVSHLKMGIPDKLPEEKPETPDRVPGDLDNELDDGTENDRNPGGLTEEDKGHGGLPQTGMKHEVLIGLLLLMGAACLLGAAASGMKKAGRG